MMVRKQPGYQQSAALGVAGLLSVWTDGPPRGSAPINLKEIVFTGLNTILYDGWNHIGHYGPVKQNCVTLQFWREAQQRLPRQRRRQRVNVPMRGAAEAHGTRRSR